MARFENILDTIGDTPLVKLQKLAPAGVNVYVKVEAFNPMGSVKDRMAKALIEKAESTGALKPGQTVVEATSGNTGIALAMVCAQKGYPLVVTMAENFSIERRKLLRFLGAKVVLTPAAEKGTGMLAKAEELARAHGYYLCRQFENEANTDIHTQTTAQEIIADFADDQLHYWVSGFGTGGTLKGVARGLKAADPGTKIVVAEPDNSPILSSGIEQPRDDDGMPNASHPHFRPHLMQGWSPDFISHLTEEAMKEGLIDEIEPVDGNTALQLSRDLARKEGIFVGISSGATLCAALAVAKRSPQGTNIVCMLPDTGERYLSTLLFDGISEDMGLEELEISQSTPGFQFSIPGDPVVNNAPATSVAEKIDEEKPVKESIAKDNVALDKTAESLVESLIKTNPIAMFALEWCEFCWSVRKLFKALNVPFESVDLDSVAYQENNRGGEIRQVLSHRLGVPTIPQIFIGGRHIGGGMDLFDIYEDGSLLAALTELGIDYDQSMKINPSDLLPQWLHPRKSA